MTRTNSRTTAPRALAAAGLLASGALLLAGCSSNSTANAGSGTSASASSSGSATYAAYTNCLKSHGVALPSGRPGGGSFSGRARPSGSAFPRAGHSGGYGGGGFGFGGASANPSEAAAMKACASLRPKGGFGGGGFGGGAGGSTALVAFESCMKSHDVTVTNGDMRSIATSTDPKTVAAYKVCKVLLPTRPSASASPSA